MPTTPARAYSQAKTRQGAGKNKSQAMRKRGDAIIRHSAPPQVTLRLGNLFDGPADLIVLPCSTAGTVTDFVARSLKLYQLPHPRGRMRLGEVDIQPFLGGQNIAQFVCFAASVAAMQSTSTAIRDIGRSLGKFTTEEPTVRTVSSPLLGAGAGGLPSETVVEALRSGFMETAAANASLVIHVLHRADFDRIAGHGRQVDASAKALRVFISYTATDANHIRWVESLGTFLRSNGIEARLDRWHLRRGMDLPQWMTNELKLADRVIIISNEQYAAKADGRLGGVGWETMIIQGDMAVQSRDSQKYLVLITSANLSAGIPAYLRTKFALHWNEKDNETALRGELLNELRGITSEPPLLSSPVVTL